MSTKRFQDPGVEMAIRLRMTAELRENALIGHLDRVALYSVDLARRLGMTRDEITRLKYAAPLHDIGKLRLDASLVDKPTRLNEPEMELIKTHTTLGYEILADSPWPVIQCAARIARSHHENWDGSGYPDRLAGEAIPLEARIVAIADVYDALLSKRPYKPAWEMEAVVEEIIRLRGHKFDPTLADLFLSHLPKPIASAA